MSGKVMPCFDDSSPGLIKRNFTKIQISKFASQALDDFLPHHPPPLPTQKKNIQKNTCLLLYVFLTFVSMSFVDIAGLIWIHSVSLVFSSRRWIRGPPWFSGRRRSHKGLAVIRLHILPWWKSSMSGSDSQSHRIHVTGIVHLHEWWIFMVFIDVHKYTSPMDP